MSTGEVESWRSTSTTRVLYVVHNHASVRAGGVEIYAQELFEAMRAREDVDASLLAKAGAPFAAIRRPHEGTMLSTISPSDEAQYFFHNDGGDYDHFLGAACSKEHLTVHLDRFLAAMRPDVVHVHHTLYLGYDALRQIRNSAPGAAIVHTLHDYLPICHRNGQLLRTDDRERCAEASPRRCHECFPSIAPREFFLRERFIKSQFAHVDLFIAPSRFLLERYVAWGIPRDKIVFEPYGRASLPSTAARAVSPGECRARFGFFGQLSLFKGMPLLLEAMKRLHETHPGAAHLWVHGNNLDLQPSNHRERIAAELASLPNVTNAGAYRHEDLPRLMENVDWVVVPSLWWENAPLVIHEAFMCGRPVITGDVGGMAEAVDAGRNGLHFRTGDARSLAEAIHHAATTPGLWAELRRWAPPAYSVAEHAGKLLTLYRQLVAERRALA